MITDINLNSNNPIGQKTMLIEQTSPDTDKISKMVFDFLCKKSLYEGVRQDYKNQTYLGGCYFYFTIKPNGDYYLSSNKHPSAWDYNAIKNEIFEIEKRLYDTFGNVQSLSSIRGGLY